MTPQDTGLLELRFRGRAPDDAPPDVAAFTRPVASTPSHAEPIAVTPGRLEPRAPLMIFLRDAAFGIPAPTGEVGLCALDSWCLRPTVFGHLVAMSRATDHAPRRAAWVLAACLPLTIATEVAAAPSDGASVQRPKSTRPATAPPQLPDPAPATDEVAADPSASSSDPPGPTTDAALEPALAPSSDPFVGPTAPPKTSGPDPALVDAAWEGVDGFDVELRLKGGGRMSGRVGAVQADTFTLIQAGTGAVLVLPKSGVLSLRVRTAEPLPAKTGVGALVGGGILTAVGSPVFISGVVFLAVCPSCTYFHLPLLLTGGAALAGGIPLLVRGTRQRDAYRRAVEQRALSPIVIRTPHGWTGGIRFRF